jgi:PKD repeat protein
MLGAAPASAAPTPAFQVSSPVVAGAEATFTDQSQPVLLPITSVTWSFGDGTVVPGEPGGSVRHAYASPGVKTVTLTATDTLGDPLGSASLQRDITVLPAPVASFVVIPQPPVAGRPANFVSTATPVPGYSISAFDWDFNQDGATDAAGATAQHTFASAGMHAVRLRILDGSGVGAVVVQPVRVNAPPEASFTVSPAEPETGEQVTLSSTARDSEGPLAEHAWDLDGDGDFDDASGASVRGTFMSPGQHAIALRVTDSDGASTTRTRAITVRGSESSRGSGDGRVLGSPPAAPFLKLMTPFPIVRLAGELVRDGARILTLSVRAPAGAQVLVRCRGGSCPAPRLKKLARRKPVRFRALERYLPAGSILEVLVRRSGQIGKYTKFRVRRNRRPRRIDACVLPNATKAVRCPRG